MSTSAPLQTTTITHRGPWTAQSRSHPSLAWLEAYTSNVKALGFNAPHHNWYAQSARYYNLDGKIYDGGDAIWKWMTGPELFGKFEGVGEVEGDGKPGDGSRVVTLIEGAKRVRPGKGVVSDYDETDKEVKKADLIFYEHTIIFYLRDLPGEGIPVKRMMEWVVADAEVEGQGWQGKQAWEGKVWWDKSILGQEVARRKAALT